MTDILGLTSDWITDKQNPTIVDNRSERSRIDKTRLLRGLWKAYAIPFLDSTIFGSLLSVAWPTVREMSHTQHCYEVGL